MNQVAFDLSELVVDSFAGGGGASTGIEAALGRIVDIAVNHDEEALAMHAANHPDTVHLREDVWNVNPRKALGRRQVGLLWASPDCKHFSKAKGGKPVSKRIRGLAWVICKWAAVIKPRVIAMENVEEFQDWGPLKLIDGQWFPDPERKGWTFNRFLTRLRNLGYKVEHHQLKACDYGAPTIRKRLFLVARRDGRPIVWPKPTHGKGLKPYRTAAECIDWSIPCPSIFERKKPLAEATLRRIARGIQRYVIDAAEPFIVPMQHQNRPTGVDEPVQTVTTQGNKFGLVVPHITKYRQGSSGSAIDVPFPTITAGSFEKRPGGNPPLAYVAAHLEHMTHGGREHAANKPLPTVTGAPRGELSVVAAALTRVDQASAAARNGIGAADEPLRTIHTAPAHAVMAANLIHVGNGEKKGQAPRCMSVEAPLGTAVGSGIKHRLVTALLAQHNTEHPGYVKPGRDVRDPLSTITAAGGQQAVIAAHLEQANTDMVGHDARKPLSTIVGKGCTQRVIASHLVKLRNNQVGQPTDEPMPTLTAGGGHVGEVRAFLIKYYGTGGQHQKVDEPLHTIPATDRIGLVYVHGEPYQIVDIGMRMLTPRELANAQGFPTDYIIDRGGDGRVLTKTAQVRMIGNSVCPPVAEAIVRANFAHEAKIRRAA